ncbi:hypothetical protein BS17DRAFT_243641 [Gyrodon lividus]|nr:hypothetical protein BS17DRAFT_243641 [Gyrodon lividus]
MSSYDQNLLDEAPRATRAQMQEGYSVDLLEDRPRRSPSVRSPATPAPAVVPLTPGIAETGSREKLGSAAYTPASRQSFWRTRNGIITIVLIAVVIVGAVVGGAVGGTAGKNSSTSNIAGSTGTTGTVPQLQGPSSTAPTTDVQGVAPATTANNNNEGGSLPTSTTPTSDPTGSPVVTANLINDAVAIVH